MEADGQADVPASPPADVTRRTPLSRTGRGLALLVVLLVAVTLFSGTASQPFHLDNMDFPAVADATAKTGLPIYYRGEVLPSHQGLYHPPLYIYLLAAWIRVFGSGHSLLRMMGFVCALLQALLVLAIVRALAGRVGAVRIAPWFLALFLLNPYTLQGASIVDIDTTIYGPILCAMLLCAVQMSFRDGQWRTDPIRFGEYAWMAFLVAVAFWAKMTTVLLFLVIVPLFLVWRLGWRRAVATWAAVAGAGITAFLLTYWVYGAVSGMDIGYSFRFLVESFLKRGYQETGFAGQLQHRGGTSKT